MLSRFIYLVFFFFKQKTAYEMRISDWSSDVCSSDLVIFGQQAVVDQTLITLLSGGHGLLIGVPGLAKTRLVETLGTVFGLEDKRVQCTPDLMPADILGSEVLEENEVGRRSFRFIAGPVFCQLLMADEINRASPRTRSEEHTSELQSLMRISYAVFC